MAMICAALASTVIAGPMVVFDTFNRDVTARGITLVDWDGYMANPAVEVRVKLPEGTQKGATLYVHGSDSRIHFDRSDASDRNGIGKRIQVDDPTKDVKFRVAIFPDRDGASEEHRLILQLFEAGKETSPREVPVSVDDRDRSLANEFSLHVDFGQDQTGWTKSSDVQRVIRQAAEDWSYFLLDQKTDAVPVGDEKTPIWNPDGFVTQRTFSNKNAFSGYLMYVYGIHHEEMRAGGAPSLVGKPHTRDGRPIGLWRSGTVEFDIAGNWNRMGWLADERDIAWWYSGSLRSEPSDLYSIALHEMGHALAFHSRYPVHGAARKEGIVDPEVVRYLGASPKIDLSDHLIGVVDPVSLYGGFGMEYLGQMKTRRWLLTKSHLLILQAYGYRMRHVDALQRLEAKLETAPSGVGEPIRSRLTIRNGIPDYRVSLVGGSLPQGVTINSFSGEFEGKAERAGVYEARIRVEDQDGTSKPLELPVTLEIR